MGYEISFSSGLKAVDPLSLASFRFTIVMEVPKFQQLDKGLIILTFP